MSIAPEGYTVVDFGGGRAVARPEATSWLSEVVASGRTLHEWAAAEPGRSTFEGRGAVYSVPAPDGSPDRWAVRHFFRGGAVAMPMGDRYLRVGRPRPFREVAASEWARSRGVRTPEVVVAATYHDGPFYRADLVTVVAEDTTTLVDRLHETDGERGWLLAMAEAGDLVRSLAAIGLYHVDLNGRNILLDRVGDGPPWIVDLDRARVLRRPSAQAEDRMLARLTRSIVKAGTPTGESLGAGEVLAALGTRRAEL